MTPFSPMVPAYGNVQFTSWKGKVVTHLVGHIVQRVEGGVDVWDEELRG